MRQCRHDYSSTATGLFLIDRKRSLCGVRSRKYVRRHIEYVTRFCWHSLIFRSFSVFYKAPALHRSCAPKALGKCLAWWIHAGSPIWSRVVFRKMLGNDAVLWLRKLSSASYHIQPRTIPAHDSKCDRSNTTKLDTTQALWLACTKHQVTNKQSTLPL